MALRRPEDVKERLLYSYQNVINGFAAVLEPHHAEALSAMPGVASVFPNKAYKLHTTRSWEFLGLEHSSGAIPPASLWTKANLGEDVIVGLLDSGVWPEAESFKDDGFGPIPSRWRGTCETGCNFTAADCNRKLIGARYFLKGYEAAKGKLSVSSTGEFVSARDRNGHGTHTASTAVGNFVEGASLFGFAGGKAKGGAPRARLAVYKVCWPDSVECYAADVLAAFDAGIHDGVDVFSLSIGSSYVDGLFSDAIAIGSFHAVMAGRVVVCAAGNDGPYPASVANVAPWIITVAASSIDRSFRSSALLEDGSTYTGSSLSGTRLSKKSMYPLVFAGDARVSTANASAGEMCLPGALDPEKVKGKIVACFRGLNPRLEKGYVVKEAGGAGMLLLNSAAYGDEVLADPHILPATHLTSDQAQSILKYINQSRSSATASITYPISRLDQKDAPKMALFSSQGPNRLVPEILKPDITAPGINILGAWTEASSPSGYFEDHRRVKFNVISGTSMSCPHVAGIVALLRALHPSWSAAAIKSALMTSATNHDDANRPIRSASNKKATPFNYGAGHVNPNAAADPGLLYDASADDYFLFICGQPNYRLLLPEVTLKRNMRCPSEVPSLLDLNYPSFSITNLTVNVTVQRTLTYVGGGPIYRSLVQPPRGVGVEVVPRQLSFSRLGEKQQFRITFWPRRRPKNTSVPYDTLMQSSWKFGYLTWTDETHLVSSPIAVIA
ncbi:hypothetical protein KP509_35G059300 [Ceratopteris richardii]|uniref:Uncharacterized protein n=1 Tax=Ceratopteris richardii TaxID=49495 RepID=A0A8T2QIM1_CERRI|nr:hypothetical protein KP509_35G059300 [Ceratopteris richardii]